MKKNKQEAPETLTDMPEEEAIEETLAATEDLEQELEALKEENQKLREDYLRAFADAENTKKRCTQEIEKNNKYAISSFAKNLLPIADNLQRALDAAGSSDSPDSAIALRKGVELIQAELYKAFEKFGISKIESLGQHFDPNFHQVIQEVADEGKEAGTIIAELQTGYMINDRILREAMVVVSKK